MSYVSIKKVIEPIGKSHYSNTLSQIFDPVFKLWLVQSILFKFMYGYISR